MMGSCLILRIQEWRTGTATAVYDLTSPNECVRERIMREKAMPFLYKRQATAAIHNPAPMMMMMGNENL